jgi:cell migration-inducing and hyaluronan-binding protein
VIFELPGFTTAAAGAEQASLAALREASETSYYKDDDTLWVKLVVAEAGNAAASGASGGPGGPGGVGGGTSIEVSR